MLGFIGLAMAAALLALWWYARAYPRHPVAPADYPWRERARGQPVEALADEVLARMTPGEKLAQLAGDGGDAVLLRLAINVFLLGQFPNIYAGRNRRLQIPPLSFTDGPRGIVVGRATALPIAMARGACWDVVLEQRVGDLLGREARAAGANYFAGVCVNLLRHPGWGRAQETFGEDPLHVGRLGAALVESVQRHNVMACVKHFALNNIENSRFYVDVRLDERTLHEVFLPQFRRCIDAGAASVMSAYNRVQGDYCGHSGWLLEDILRGQWGFRGFVSSDWMWGVHDAAKGVNAGLDIEMPRAHAYGGPLRRALADGAVSWERIDTLVRRILRTKISFAARDDIEVYTPAQIACASHVQLAQEVAEKSLVLLQNRDDCLPFTGVRTLAVIGALAAQPNTGDRGSSRTAPPFVITILEGLREAWGADRILYSDGRDPDEAARLAAQADAAVIVAGRAPDDEGENIMANRKPGGAAKVARGGDRVTLALDDSQIAMIRHVGAAQTRNAVVLIGGSAIYTDGWAEAAGAIAMAWYPGMSGGHAVARVLRGEVNFSGRLPFAWPSLGNRLPPFDPVAETAEYGYYHGYTWFDETRQQPAYPFGFGLSYTQFTYSDPAVRQRDGVIAVEVVVHNIGNCAGRDVVQCYCGPVDSPVPRHRKRLQAFQPVDLMAGEQRRVGLEFSLDQLARYEPQHKQWIRDAGRYRIWIGSNSREQDCMELELEITV